MATIRFRHLVRTDPGGAWVAEDEHGIAGCALALRREGIWGLSLLVVRPDLQSAGLGSALLRRANEYAAGARGRIILSSPDPRALRAYARLGLALHPSCWARACRATCARPTASARARADDIPFTEAVDRHVRGAAHGADIGAQLDDGPDAADRARPRLRGRRRRRAAAAGGVRRRGARDLLRAVLARADGKATVGFITGAQQWAVEVCVEAGWSCARAARCSSTATSAGSRPTCRAARSCEQPLRADRRRLRAPPRRGSADRGRHPRRARRRPHGGQRRRRHGCLRAARPRGRRRSSPSRG